MATTRDVPPILLTLEAAGDMCPLCLYFIACSFLWVCQALGRPKIGLTTKLESAEAGPGENGSAQPRKWTRPGQKLDAAKLDTEYKTVRTKTDPK